MFREDLAQIPSYVPGKRMPDALKLSSNEVSDAPLPNVAEAMAKAAAGVNRYPDMAAVDLRDVLADHLGIPAEDIAVGCGSSALGQQLVQITAGKGDEVIFPWRSFEAYPIFTQVTGATPRPIPLTESGHHDLKAMAAAINEHTKLIFVCNPNNPTGSIVSEQAFINFMDQVPPEVIVALDEAYIEYVREADTPISVELLSRYPNLIGMRTFSKAFGLAGIRVGYAFGKHEVIDALNKVAIPFGVNAVAQAGAVAALGEIDALMERTDEVATQRSRVAEVLDANPSQANFVWLPKERIASGPTPAHTPAELAELFAKHNVLVRAFPEGVRITVTNQQEMDQLLKVWQTLVEC